MNLKTLIFGSLVTASTIWPAMFGNGAPTDIGLMLTTSAAEW